MRNWLILLAAFSLTIALVLFPGCGDEDEDNPAGPGGGTDTLDAEAVLGEIESFVGSFDQIAESCPPVEFLGSLLDEAVMAQNEWFALFLLNMLQTEDITTLYGTWQGDPTGGAVPWTRVNAQPDSAIKLLVIGADSLGNLLNGDLTIYEMDLGGAGSTMNLNIDIAVHVEGFSDSLHLNVVGTVGVNGEGGISSADLTVSGNSCAVLFSVTFETTDGLDMDLYGWYEIPSVDKVNFNWAGAISGAEGADSVAGTFHLWTEAPPTFDLQMTITSDEDTCMTGEIKIDGNLAATIYTANCDAEEPDVWIVIDGVSYDGEAYIESLMELLGAVEDVELPGVI